MKVKSIGLLLLIMLLTACSGGGGGSTPTPAPAATAAAQPSAVAVPTSTTQPLPSSTPVQGRVVLVAPPEAGTALAEAARGVLADLAGAAKLAFETRSALAAADLKPEFKIIVFLQAPADLAALLAAAPQSQFAVVGGSELEAKGNLSVIRQREELRTFMAGYITTLIAPDWRSLGLVPNAPATLLDAFINGGRYWCGRCVPMYPPVVLFPLASSQPAGTPAAGWQAAVTALQKNVLQSVYLAPGVQTPELVKTLFSQKLILTGTQPPAAEIKPLWGLTLSYDTLAPLKKLWPDLMAGKGGQSTDANLIWTDVNETYFTVGKQRLAQQTLSGLLDGSISPFTVPDN